MRLRLQVAAATFAVALCPIAIVVWLRASGTVSSPLLGLLLGLGLSLGASWLGCVYWESRRDSEDVLFNELLIWGFLRRRRNERRPMSARDLLGSMSQAQNRAGLSVEGQAELLEQLAARLDTRDPFTHGHSRRVARHAWMIATRMGLPREEVARVRTAAAVHDVGKIETPMEILRKRASLSHAEYEVIKRHPIDRARMAAALCDAELTAIVLHHHERLDGAGYPNGLSGEEIPLGARIIAVADTFDAITSARPYRSARTHKKAIEILKREAGTQLDPVAVRALCSHYSGKRPLAVWALISGTPDRIASTAGSLLTSAAAAAKVVVATAIVSRPVEKWASFAG